MEGLRILYLIGAFATFGNIILASLGKMGEFNKVHSAVGWLVALLFMLSKIFGK